MPRLLYAAMLLLALHTAKAAAPIPNAEARRIFAEAENLVTRDGGKLWGQSLAGPMMFVDPDTHAMVANQHGPAGALREQEGVFTGTFPAEMTTANTSVDWLGTRWTQVLWPLPEDAEARHVLLMHESFHRIQPALGLWPKDSPANAHLDTLEGRYLLRLEWLALARALQMGDHDPTLQTAITDALVFRARRQEIFLGAQAEENTLEETEGLAEYTGVRLGCPDGIEQQTRYALGDLSRTAQLDTFVRSFAYATGPAYGLLLDRYESDRNHPAWHDEFKAGPDFARLLAARAKVRPPDDLTGAVRARTDDAESQRVRREEEGRETRRQQILAADRKRFVEGGVLRITLRHMSVQFDPRNLRPLDKLGTVYPTMRVSDDWGVLQVSDGALLGAGWDQITLAAPSPAPAGTKISGPGWTLELAAGWKLVADRRDGDFRLEAP